MQMIDCMKNHSDETEKVYRNFIGFSIKDFPNGNIKLSNYGIYKARLGTTLMVAIGAHYSKLKLENNNNNNKEFFDDIQIASAIAHLPFSEKNESINLNDTELSDKTGEITKYFLNTLKECQEDIYFLKYKTTDNYFKKIQIYFHNCFAESISEKETMNQIINRDNFYFENLTRQNFKVMSDFMKL